MKLHLNALLPLLLLLNMVPAPAQELTAPSAGWNRTGQVDHREQASVAYPYAPIERGAQTRRSMIKGKIAASKDKRVRHQLVVNGNPMPLLTDQSGYYARPYRFGSGSNSVELRTPDGKSIKRLQFYEAGRNGPQPVIRVICSWDDPDSEIDMHILTPDGQHAWWAGPVLKTGGGLDTDSVDGPGPEMFTMTSPMRGNYHVYINYWGKLGDNGYHFDETGRRQQIITARITLVFHENTPREKRESMVLPLRSIGDLTLVKSFLF